MRTQFVRSSFNRVVVLPGLLLVATCFASGQAIVSAQRGAQLAPFIQATLQSPDWGPTDDTGFTAGLDYTRYIRAIVQPSLEFRATRASGTTVNESTYAGGLKLETLPIHGIRPYATLLIGHGSITFIHPTGTYYGDASLIYSYGGGAELNITSQLRMRFDFTEQHWNLDPSTLTPITAAVGLSYTIPFHRGRVE